MSGVRLQRRRPPREFWRRVKQEVRACGQSGLDEVTQCTDCCDLNDHVILGCILRLAVHIRLVGLRATRLQIGREMSSFFALMRHQGYCVLNKAALKLFLSYNTCIFNNRCRPTAVLRLVKHQNNSFIY